MQGHLNAVGIIACVVVTGVTIALSRRRSMSSMHLALGVLSLLVTCFLVAIIAFHRCGLGQPFSQWLVPGLCCMVVVCAVERPWLRRIIAAVLMIAAVGLSHQYSDLVHEPEFAGRRTGYWEDLRSLDPLTEMLSKRQEGKLDAGWIRDLVPDLTEVERAVLADLKVKHRYSEFWHTWFSNLYHVDLVPADVWFTGGLITPSGRLEIRELDRRR
ncbi:MAG: hypothetical protein ACKVX7_15430 [Planctomycetota bacterium]